MSQLRTLAAMLLLALAYFATGRLGLTFPAIGTEVTLLWLPSGIAVAALLRWGFSYWPGIWLGSVAIELSIGAPGLTALGIATGNTLGPLLAAWLLRRGDFHPAFDRSRDILVLAAAGLVGMLVGSTLGVASLVLAGMLPDDRIAAWLTWWAGDTTAVITAAPLVLAFTRKELRAILFRRAEFVIWLCLTVLVTWGVFVMNRDASGHALSISYLPLPFVAWAALRFGPVGTSLALITLAVGAAGGTATGHGPFFRPDPLESAAVLWIFMATSAVLGWLIAALHTARARVAGTQLLFEEALSDISLGVLLAGLDRNITYANQGFTRLTGYTEPELLGKSCALLQGPETDAAIVEKLRAALRGDGFFDGEILNYRKDGTTFWNALLISPVRDEHGDRTGFIGLQRDISQRKATEAALRQSEEHRRTIIELEPECVKLLSPGGRLLEMNPAGLAMIEATSFEQVRDHPIADLIVPEDRATFASMHARVMRGESGRCEFAITGLRGTRRYMETNAVPYRNVRHDIVGVLGITRDITQQREAAVELEQSLFTLQLFIDTVPAYISFVDKEERYRLVNRHYEEYFGRPAAEIVGRRLAEIQSPAAYAEMQPHVRAALAGRTVRYQSNPASPDGESSVWFDAQYVPRRDANGEVSGFFVLIFDITESKRAEIALRESEERYRTLARFVPVGIFRADGEGNCLYVNDRWCEMSGMTAEQSLGRGWADALHSEDRERVIGEWQDAAHAGRRFQSEYRLQTQAGKITWLHVAAVALRDPDGRITSFLGSTTDITEVKQAAEERRKLEAHLQHTQKLESLGVLAGGIAHDFNNLLTSVLGNASIAATELSPGSPARACIEEITETSLRAADLCKQMLAYSGRGRFVLQKLDLGQLVEGTTRMLQISISKSAVLRFDLAQGLPPVEVDATQVRQVIMNLVINASEAIGNRSGVISVATGLTRVDREHSPRPVGEVNLAEGEYVFLEVSDNGCGMSEDTRAKVFEPFFTTKFTGRGLGLAAVLGIVRGHQGAATVDSQLGRGTTFKLFFPAAAGASDSAPLTSATAPAWQGSGTVLVVDDEETMRSTVGRMVRRFGLEPVLAAHGLEAVELFRADPDRFALVLLDLTMPHMDGEQTFIELRRLRPGLRVVLMSGFDAQEAMVRFAGNGPDSFLQKPFTIEGLRNVLQGVLG